VTTDEGDDDERIINIARGVRELNEATEKVQKLVERMYIASN
jgi:hypothetical protein